MEKTRFVTTSFQGLNIGKDKNGAERCEAERENYG